MARSPFRSSSRVSKPWGVTSDGMPVHVPMAALLAHEREGTLAVAAAGAYAAKGSGSQPSAAQRLGQQSQCLALAESWEAHASAADRITARLRRVAMGLTGGQREGVLTPWDSILRLQEEKAGKQDRATSQQRLPLSSLQKGLLDRLSGPDTPHGATAGGQASLGLPRPVRREVDAMRRESEAALVGVLGPPCVFHRNAAESERTGAAGSPSRSSAGATDGSRTAQERELRRAVQGVTSAPGWALERARRFGVPLSIDGPGTAALGLSRTDLGLLSDRSDVRAMGSSLLARFAAGMVLAAPFGPMAMLAGATDVAMQNAAASAAAASGTAGGGAVVASGSGGGAASAAASAGGLTMRAAIVGSMAAVVPAAMLFFGSYWTFEYAARWALGRARRLVDGEAFEGTDRARAAARALVLANPGMLRAANDDSGGSSHRLGGFLPGAGGERRLPPSQPLAGGALPLSVEGVLEEPLWDSESY